ncbi:hypothetical protein KP004_03150 [Geomonas oryzisoli]|uniref:Uncharacterized protein n=1 Tax=Geomonas oryzisoli TaxID=2847992 RepID=A0ABX8J6Y4_9BACT|nr:hypothetical protein [Geomonas oryzisoli]QWV94204.1 hypothetical protein KP004_03150 [Geomonas oryzisoli]
MKWMVMVCLILASSPALAENVWLVIGASDSTPAGIARKWKRSGEGQGIVVQTRDCGDNKNIFVWAAHLEPSAAAAAKSLKASHLSGGYVKKCSVKAGTLLAFRETAVDPSIADVPSSTVNWEDIDRVSTIQPLQGNRHIIISRYYSGTIEDALEGRRERVVLVGQKGQRHLLQENCVTPEKFTVRREMFAYQCALEQAGDELLHKVVVFSMDGKKMEEIKHCRSPVLTQKGTIACESEAVNADGRLSLHKLEQQL